jgi:hypothetical protein
LFDPSQLSQGAAMPAEPDAPRPDRLMQALEPIKAILEEDGSLDEMDLVVIEDIRSKLMKILADRAKQSDQMLGGKIDPRAARRLA